MAVAALQESQVAYRPLIDSQTPLPSTRELPMDLLKKNFPFFDQRLAYVKVTGELEPHEVGLYNNVVLLVDGYDRLYNDELEKGRIPSILFEVARADVWEGTRNATKAYTIDTIGEILFPLDSTGNMLDDGESVGLVTERMSNDIVWKKFADHMSMLVSINSEHSIYAAPIAGASNIAAGLMQRGLPVEKLYLPDLRGTNGAQTGGDRTQVVEFPHELRDTDNTLIIAEDIVDSCNTAFEFVSQRLFGSYQEIPDDLLLQYNELLQLRDENEQLNRKDTSYGDLQFDHIYRRLAELMVHTDTVMTAFVCKNPAFKTILERVAVGELDHGKKRWAYQQLTALHSMIDMPQEKWVVGGNANISSEGEQLGMYDMGTKGSDLLPYIAEQDPEFAAQLQQNGLEKMTLRLGARIGPMLWFKYDTPRAKETYMREVARYFIIKRREGVI